MVTFAGADRARSAHLPVMGSFRRVTGGVNAASNVRLAGLAAIMAGSMSAVVFDVPPSVHVAVMAAGLAVYAAGVHMGGRGPVPVTRERALRVVSVIPVIFGVAVSVAAAMSGRWDAFAAMVAMTGAAAYLAYVSAVLPFRGR